MTKRDKHGACTECGLTINGMTHEEEQELLRRIQTEETVPFVDHKTVWKKAMEECPECVCIGEQNCSEHCHTPFSVRKLGEPKPYASYEEHDALRELVYALKAKQEANEKEELAFRTELMIFLEKELQTLRKPSHSAWWSRLKTLRKKYL